MSQGWFLLNIIVLSFLSFFKLFSIASLFIWNFFLEIPFILRFDYFTVVPDSEFLLKYEKPSKIINMASWRRPSSKHKCSPFIQNSCVTAWIKVFHPNAPNINVHSCDIIPITTDNLFPSNIFAKNSLPGYQGDNRVSEEVIYETCDVCRKQNEAK